MSSRNTAVEAWLAFAMMAKFGPMRDGVLSRLAGLVLLNGFESHAKIIQDF
jgi:hypothetical protein